MVWRKERQTKRGINMSHKCWGHFGAQTVRQCKNKKSKIIIREGLNEITLGKREIDSLIQALLQMRK